MIDLIDSGESNHSQQEGSEVTSICLVWGKYSWLSGNEVETKLIKSCRREIGKNTSADVASFRIKDAESDLFVSLSIKK